MNDTPSKFRRVLKVYEWLLLVYPRDYRREYGKLMTQFFCDECCAVSRRGNRWSLLSMCLHTGFDLVFSAFREHLAQHLPRLDEDHNSKTLSSLFSHYRRICLTVIYDDTTYWP